MVKNTFKLLLVSLMFAQIAVAVEVVCGPDGALLSVKHENDSAKISQPRQAGSVNGHCFDLNNCVERLLPQGQLRHIADFLSLYADRASIAEGRGEMGAMAEEMRKMVDRCRNDARELERKDNEKIYLAYSLKGPNRQKAANYEKNAMQDIVDFSIKAGVDPFMALAIVAMENPPLTNGLYKRYASDYGVIPVDAIAAYSVMGCARGRGLKHATNAQLMEFKKISAAYYRELELFNKRYKNRKGNGGEIVTKLYKLASYEHSLKMAEQRGASHKRVIDLKMKIDEEKKAIEVATKNPDAARAARQYEELKVTEERYQANERQFRSRLGKASAAVMEELYCHASPRHCYGILIAQKKPQYYDLSFRGRPRSSGTQQVCAMDRRLGVGAAPELTTASSEKHCCAEVKGAANPTVDLKSWFGALYLRDNIQNCVAKHSLTYCIQKFNGTGCIGCMKSVKNKCLDGIVMADRPVYGARVADLMLNMFMGNEKIRELIEESAERLRAPIKSTVCIKKGKGKHRIAVDEFLKEQQKYLLHAANGNYKARINGRLRLPATLEEKEAYRKRERARADSCQSQFQ